MKLHAPHLWLFLIAALLAMLGIFEHFNMAIPGLGTNHPIWLAFLGWFILAIATTLPSQSQPSS